MIPKIIHFYWGGEKLSYLRYLTIYTFCKQNPDWIVKYYTPKQRSTTIPWATHEQKGIIKAGDCSSLLKQLPIEQIEFDFNQIGISNELNEVHKSDFLRLYLLSTVGGLWSDMDILYFKPMNLSLEYNTCLCSNPIYYHSVGFLLASSNNSVFNYLFQNAKRLFNPTNYQTIGAKLYNDENETLNIIDRNIFNIPMDIVYSYDAQEILKIFNGDDLPLKFTSNSIGLHWFAGHPLAGQYQNAVEEISCRSFENVLGKTLKLALGDK
jgi:hypothetical protein